MKPRMSVARCCCPKPGTTPPVGPPLVQTRILADSWARSQDDPDGGNRDPQWPSGSTFPMVARSGLQTFDTQTEHVYWENAFFLFQVNLAQGTQIARAEIMLRETRAYFSPQMDEPVFGQRYTEPLMSTPWSYSGSFFTGNRLVIGVYGATARAEWRAEDVDDAVQYSTWEECELASNDLNSVPSRVNRTYRTAERHLNSTDAFDYDVTGLQPEADWVSLVDCTDMVQHILDRPGWVSGNQMQFFALDDGSDFATHPTDIRQRQGTDMQFASGFTSSTGHCDLVIRLPA